MDSTKQTLSESKSINEKGRMLLEPISHLAERHHWTEVQTWKQVREAALSVYPLSHHLSSMWELLPSNHEKQGSSSIPSVSRGALSFKTEIDDLDSALLGGIRSTFLTEIASTKLRSTASSFFCTSTHSLDHPSRMIAAQTALSVVNGSEEATVWWLHPSPVDTSLSLLFAQLAPPRKSGEKSRWEDHILVSPINSFETLWSMSLEIQEQLDDSSPSLFPAPLRLVVIEDFSVFVQREFYEQADQVSGMAMSAPDRFTHIVSLVNLWKSVALHHNVAILFLTSASVTVSPSARGLPNVVGFDDLSRAFSHAMNIRLRLYPGWLRKSKMRAYIENRGGVNEREGWGSGGSSVFPVCKAAESEAGKIPFLGLIQVIKSPVSEERLIPFVVTLGSRRSIRGVEMDQLSSRKEAPGKVGSKRGRSSCATYIWVTEQNLSGIDPLDYVFSLR